MRRLLLPLLLLIGLPAAAADPTTRARQLAALRAEVEALSSQLTLDKEELSARLRAMDAQRADLEVQVRREELRLQQLSTAAEEQREALAADRAAGEVLRPALAESFAAVDAAIAAGLPYRTAERRQALSDLRDQLDEDLLTPQQAAARLWAFVEDERRLARENAVDRQVIELSGQEVLVEVARLGMVALLFRAEDGRVGWARREGRTWTWAEATTPEDQARVTEVFDTLARQIRVAWLELPGSALQGAVSRAVVPAPAAPAGGAR